MKTFLLFALFLCSITTKATNYYVSSVLGDDSRTAAAAQNPSTPWKTLNKLNSVFSTFIPGDSILLKRGDKFYGTLIIKKSGTSRAPIVIAAYGKGEDPIVTGLVSLTWVSKGNGLWISNEALGLPALNLVAASDIPAGMGRWPNLDNGNGGYDSIRSSTSNSLTDKPGLITSPSAGKPSYFVGAEIVVRTKRWALDRHPITAYSSSNGTITFDPTSTNEVHSPNFGYFIQDDSTVLDRQNEWWYNRASKKLKIYSTSSPQNVSAANVQNLLSSLNFSYVTVDNITFNGCNADAITIEDGSHITIQNCTIKNAGRNGVKATAPYCSFLYNTILDVMSKGILVNPEADHTTIRYNTVRNVSQIAGSGTSQKEDSRSSFSGDGVYIKGEATVVEYNTFTNMGYSAVHVTKVDSIIIRYNFIDTVCNVFDDGGAIYSYTGAAYVNYGRQISNNIILHGIGAFFGSGVRGGSAAGAGVAGIYNDRGTSGAMEDFNTVAFFEKGVFMNYGCNRISITNNTFYDNGSGLQINTRLQDPTRNLTINRNISVAAIKAQRTLNTYSDDGDVLNLFGAIDNNFYTRPIDDKITMSWQTDQGSGNIHNASLADWQAKFPMYDANSKKGVQAITSASQMRFEYNASMTDKTITLDGTYKDAKGNTYANNITLQAFRSVILMKTTAEAVPPTVSLTSPTVTAVFTAPTSINIAAIAADADGSVVKVEFYNGATLLNTNSTSPYNYIWNNVAPGKYAITAKATDNTGLYTISDTIKVTVSRANVAPAITITNPVTGNANFFTPASIVITADAHDSDGTISGVNFYNGTTLIGADNSSPYSFTWNNVAPGNYALTATATDNGNLVTASSIVNVSVIKPNVAPTVSITNPSAIHTPFIAPASIIITADAADNDGTVSVVNFYNGTTLLGSDNSSPYSFTWNNVAPGNYTLTAKATDNGNLVTTSSAVNVTVIKPNVAPTVSITNPLTGNANFFAPASIVITADAADYDGTVSVVNFYNGTTLLGSDNSSPYSFTWNNVVPGNYALTAKATDNGNLVTVSSAVNVTVLKAKVAPTVAINSSVSDTIFTAPASISISAKAADTDGSISKVEFYNGSILLKTERTFPYAFTWSNVPAGIFKLTAVATDNDGLVTSSSAVTVTVIKPNVAPAVSITSPSVTRFMAPAAIIITAAASDADGSITKVEFYNGSTLLKTETTAPYTFTWTDVPAGSYTLTAIATDNQGTATPSTPVIVSVIKPNVAPMVSLTSPSATNFASRTSITITAAATDADGSIAKVEFYDGTVLLTIENKLPYSWIWQNASAGNHTITAVATDNAGLTTRSRSVTISVGAGSSAAVSVVKRQTVNYTETVITENNIAEIAVGPNPASNVLSVFTGKLLQGKKMEISIVSLSGQLIKTIVSNTSTKTTTINISSLASGLYLLRLKTNNTVINKQFEKQ